MACSSSSSSSSTDERDLKLLHSVVVHPEQILRKSAKRTEATSLEEAAAGQATDVKDGEEERLPQGYQERLWKALDKKLHGALGDAPTATASESAVKESVTAAPGSLLAGSGMSLFKRSKMGAFSPETVNRRASTRRERDFKADVEPNRRKRKAKEHLEPEQLRKRAEAAAIDAEALTAAAVRHAAAAAPHMQPAEPCCSDDDDFEPQGTVTRVLRGFKANAILTGNMQPSRHKRFKLSGSKPEFSNGQQNGAPAARTPGHQFKSGSTPAPMQQQSPSAGKRASIAFPFKGGSGVVAEGSVGGLPDETGIVHTSSERSKSKHKNGYGDGDSDEQKVPNGCDKLSEEERKARKRAKKQRQKQAQKSDPARKAREKENRARRRALKKGNALGGVPPKEYA